MAYLGNQPALSYTSFAQQTFTIVNSQTAYTLDHSVSNGKDILLYINNVKQIEGSSEAYTASGTTLTLSSALTNGTDTMYCVFIGKAVQTVNPPSGSVGLSQLSATGTKDATTFLRGDNTFASAGGGTMTPAFQVSLSANQTLTNSTFTKIQFDLEEFDTASAYDNSTNYRFTVPSGEDGKYFFYTNVSVQGLADQKKMILRIYKNGLPKASNRTTLGTGDDTGVSVQVSLDLSASDYIEVFVYQNDTGTENASGNPANSWMASSFGGYKIIE